MSVIIKEYKQYLKEQLDALYTAASTGATPIFETGYEFKVVEEASFADPTETDRTILVVVKYLTGIIMASSVAYPVQLMIYAEANGIDIARYILDTFATTKSMTAFIRNFKYYKQTYSTSVVMSTFNPGPDGFRGMLYLSGTLVVTENILDVAYIKIMGKKITANSVSISYNAQPDNQRVEGQEINTTLKHSASVMLQFDTINIDDVADGTLVGNRFYTALKNLRNGTISGNTTFLVELYKADDTLYESYTMLVINQANIYVPGDLPRIQITMMK
jgi:hypothetical protein